MIRRVTQVALHFFWVFSLYKVQKMLGKGIQTVYFQKSKRGCRPSQQNAILISVDAP
jgi:hypothetical protein